MTNDSKIAPRELRETLHPRAVAEYEKRLHALATQRLQEEALEAGDRKMRKA